MPVTRIIDYDHIKPIWDALDPEGQFYVRPSTKRPGTMARGLPHQPWPVIIAGYPDYRRVNRQVIFVEHGAGENYGLGDPHYSGGAGRDRVDLFLCPNERVYAANEEKYPGRSRNVGSPRVEWLRQLNAIGRKGSGSGQVGRDGRLRVAVSFHWDCRLHPQTRSAFPHYQEWFHHWATDPRIELVGHAHPRLDRAEQTFARAGIEFMPNFEDVIAWADVYAVDNSSTLFEAVACGLDVVVLDSPLYTAEETGFRFWKYADIGPRIQSGEDFVEAASLADADSLRYSEIRHQAVAEIFGVVEGSTTRAVEAITEYAASSSRPSDPGAFKTQPSLFGSG